LVVEGILRRRGGLSLYFCFADEAAAMTDVPSDRLPTPPRLRAIDMARGLALIGMLMVHFGPEDAPGVAGTVYGFGHGRASILFAVVAGIGMALLAESRAGTLDARLRLLTYAVLLLPLGLLLQRLDHSVAVIIQHYAGFFVFGAIVIGLSRATLLAMAATMTVLGPAVYFAGRLSWPAYFGRHSAELGDGPLQVLTALIVSGPYPLLTWSAPLLWGLWLGRQDLRGRALPWMLIAGGAGAALVALGVAAIVQGLFGDDPVRTDWQFLFVASAHSQMPLWIIQSVGVAMAAIGLCLALERRIGRAAIPLARLGAMTLSVYTVHILALTLMPDAVIHDDVEPATTAVAVFVVGAIIFAMAWTPLGRGPLEQVLHGTWMLIRGAPVRPDPVTIEPRKI
jgi:uncharacterized membrane protein